MDRDSSTEKKTGLFKKQMHMILLIIILFVFAPRLLGFVFGLSAIGGLMEAPAVLRDEYCPAYIKISRGIEIISAWLLTFGFGFQKDNLIITGLSLLVFQSVIDWYIRYMIKVSWSAIAYLFFALLVCMLYMVAAGVAPVGVVEWL